MRRVLDDGEVVLRPLVVRDAGELFLLCDKHRALLRPTMTWVDRTTAIADMKYYILTLDGFWKAGITYGIFENGELMGTVGFHHSDMRNDKTEIGYWLAPPCHGRGLGTRCVRLALEAAFRFTSVNRIEAKIQPDNKPSIKLIEKLGFVFEGRERQGIKFAQEYKDHMVYSLLRQDREIS
jgi:ribosomal-protein-serine acetyltransferase